MLGSRQDSFDVRDHEIKDIDPVELEKALTVDTHALEVSRDLKSRNFCIFALCLGIAVGITSLAVGCEIIVSGKVLLPDFLRNKYMTMGTIDYPFPQETAKHYLSGHRVFAVPEAAMLFIGFVLNVCLTILFDCMSFIQNTTLRWALCKEGRLVYNSNPRLFVGARHFAPNWRSSNAISAVALAVGYGSISALTYSIYIVGISNGRLGFVTDVPVPGPRFAIDFNGYGFIGLGVALLLQGAISSWCLAKSKIVPTWSSNPFTTTLVCKMLGLADHNTPSKARTPEVDAIISAKELPHRVDTVSTWLTTSDGDLGLIVSRPQNTQPSMRQQVPFSRKITYVVWTLFAMVLLWLVLVAAFGSRAGSCTKAYVEQMNYRTDFLAYWQSYCQVAAPYYVDPYFDRRDWLGLIIQCLVISVISLSIHCAELLTDVTRDEFAWRKAMTTGADAGRGALMEGATSWVCWITFAFKSITPWMFGMTFNTNLMVFSNLIPLCVLATLLLLLAIFSEYLVRRHPKGPQPCTYGNISKLASLVDEWHPRMFWGDKGMIDGRIRQAGTAGRRLADLDMSSFYANLKV